MKILLPLLLLPLLVQSQSIKVDSFVIGNYKIVGDEVYTKVLPEPKLYSPFIDTIPEKGNIVMSFPDTLPPSLNITSKDLQYYGGSNWYTNSSTEIKKGVTEFPIQVMDSGMKVDVVETRDTVYECPYNYITYFTNNGQITKRENYSDCKLEKVITTRRYKLYIINEYGQKEYLSMELTKQK